MKFSIFWAKIVVEKNHKIKEFYFLRAERNKGKKIKFAKKKKVFFLPSNNYIFSLFVDRNCIFFTSKQFFDFSFLKKFAQFVSVLTCIFVLFYLLPLPTTYPTAPHPSLKMSSN